MGWFPYWASEKDTPISHKTIKMATPMTIFLVIGLAPCWLAWSF
jgi:hypothetical protein